MSTRFDSEVNSHTSTRKLVTTLIMSLMNLCLDDQSVNEQNPTDMESGSWQHHDTSLISYADAVKSDKKYFWQDAVKKENGIAVLQWSLGTCITSWKQKRDWKHIDRSTWTCHQEYWKDLGWLAANQCQHQWMFAWSFRRRVIVLNLIITISESRSIMELSNWSIVKLTRC